MYSFIKCFELKIISTGIIRLLVRRDKSMDCLSPMQNKRRRSGEVEQWHKQSKRLCNGLGGCGQSEYSQVMDAPMDTWDPPKQGPQNGHAANGHVPGMQVLGAPGRGAGQFCPRCMAGEPGHINHIMRY